MLAAPMTTARASRATAMNDVIGSSGVPSGWEPASVHKAVELGGVVADDLFAGGFGQVAELFADVFLRVRVDAVRVRKVRAPHDVVFAELVDQFDPDRI